ncbi:hypothetical protein OIU76_019489 [Salix suchowensis]|nr:hypothetical protein OIU76_019489 [Salix suchowensis]
MIKNSNIFINAATYLAWQKKLLKMSHKSSSVRDQKQQQVNPEIMAQAIDMEVLKKNSPLHSSVTSPRLHRALTKPRSTERGNCLCSPTTHAGSFKCRFHRSSGMIRGGSIGSNLSELVGKSRAINDLV